MKEFYESEKTAVQEYLSKIGTGEEYGKVLANYQKLIVCEKLDSECGTKATEAEARKLEAYAKILEADNRKIEAQARLIEANNRTNETAARLKEADNRKLEAISEIVSTVIETAGRVTVGLGTSFLAYKSLIAVCEFEIDGNLPPKLISLARNLIVKA